MVNKVATKPSQTLLASESVEPTFQDCVIPGEHFTQGTRGSRVLRKPSIQYKFQASSMLGEISYFKDQNTDFCAMRILFRNEDGSFAIYEYEGNSETLFHVTELIKADQQKKLIMDKGQKPVSNPSPGSLYNAYIKMNDDYRGATLIYKSL
jgi:hypothetical protein